MGSLLKQGLDYMLLKPAVGHIILLQVVWWSTILSSVHIATWPWLCSLWIFIFFALHRLSKIYDHVDFVAAVSLLVIGIVLDTLWIYLGLIQHVINWPFVWTCPLWLITLWFCLGYDFRHSLGWMKDKPVISGLLAGASGPSSYWGGAALGIADIPQESQFEFALLLFVSWAIIFPLFAKAIYSYELKKNLHPKQNYNKNRLVDTS